MEKVKKRFNVYPTFIVTVVNEGVKLSPKISLQFIMIALK